MSSLSLAQALFAGFLPLFLIGVVLRRRSWPRQLAAGLLALPPVAVLVPALLALPPWAWLSAGVSAALVLGLVRWRGARWRTAVLGMSASAVLLTWIVTWASYAFSPGCPAVWNQPGTVRLDHDARFERALFLGMNRGDYSVDVDAAEGFVYAGYAHGGNLRGLARFPFRASGKIEMLEVGAGGILHPRLDAATGRVFATDQVDHQLYVAGGDPLQMIDRIDVGSSEPMDVGFDDAARKLLVVDRTENAHAAERDQRGPGVLVLSLDEPRTRLGRIPLAMLPGAEELIPVPGERRVFVTSEAFVTMAALDLTTGAQKTVTTFLPGVGGAAVDVKRRELYLTHPAGLVQVRDLDDLHRRRTLVVHGARAVAVDPERGALYVGDYFGGTIRRIDPDTGDALGKARVGLRMRQMRVLRDGRLLTASACGVMVLSPP